MLKMILLGEETKEEEEEEVVGLCQDSLYGVGNTLRLLITKMLHIDN